MIELRNLLASFRGIVEYERSAPLVGCGVGIASVDDLTIEEQHISRIHLRGYRFDIIRKLETRAGTPHAKEVTSVLVLGITQKRKRTTSRHDTQCTGVRVASVHGDPCRHTGPWPDRQRIVVLVQALTTSSGWLEVEHALRCKRLLSGDSPEEIPDPLIKQILETYPSEFGIRPVRVEHSRVAEQWVIFVSILLLHPWRPRCSLADTGNRSTVGGVHDNRKYRLHLSLRNEISDDSHPRRAEGVELVL